MALRLHVNRLSRTTFVMTRNNKRQARWESSNGDGFRHVLVPTDLTDRTAKAFDLALRLARRRRSRLTLLHVIQVVPGIEMGELAPFYEKLDKRARTKMATFASRAPREIPVRIEVVYGARAESIISVARKRRVDLIVLASHRVNPVMVGRDWGTISYKVGILAPCPVLLVK
jgi:universal stress protein A